MGAQGSVDLMVFVLFPPGEFVDENISQEDLTEERGEEVPPHKGQQQQSEGHVLSGRRKYFKLHSAVRPPVRPDCEEQVKSKQQQDINYEQPVLPKWFSVRSALI